VEDNTALLDGKMGRAVQTVNTQKGYRCIVSQKIKKDLINRQLLCEDIEQSLFHNNFPLLCSMHFDEAAFTVNTGIAQSLNMRRKLRNDAVPTKDCMESTQQETQAVSDRVAGWYCTTVLVFVYQTINDSTVVLKSYHNIVFKFHYIQQILCEVSWNEGEVVSETEDIHPSVEVDSSGDFCEEPSGQWYYNRG
jgi:hypothetical protein